MTRTTWLKRKDILFVYSGPLPSLPHPTPYQHLKFFPGTSKYQLDQQSVCAKDLLQNIEQH